MSILLSNSSIELSLINKHLYIKIKNLIDVDKNDIDKTILYYKFIHKILNDNNLKLFMIVDFANADLSFNSINYIKIFINLLQYINPLSNTTVYGTFIIITNNIAKTLIDLILNVYKNSKPIYIINNNDDILNLIE